MMETHTMNAHRLLLKLLVLSIALAFGLFVSGCSSNSKTNKMSNESEMPDFVKDAPVRVKETYQYAMDHPDDLAKNPCYCGCGNMGHTSNLSCFIKPNNEGFESHAAGCGICVDIAQDVMRLKGEGQSAPQIRNYIDAKYSAFGPSTDTPFPTE